MEQQVFELKSLPRILLTQPTIPDAARLYEGFDRVIDRRWFTNNGEELVRLERALGHYLNASYTSIFTNGTIALMVALRALDLKGSVLTTPFTFPATTQSIVWGGLRPVFCDIDEETLCLDATRIEDALLPDTTAIVGVHVYGNPCAIEAIEAIAQRKGLAVIYDAAHCFGLRYNGLGIGEFGDVSMFSFHATKIYNTLEGGALTTRRENIDRRLRLLRNFGFEGEDCISDVGINGKLDEFRAVIGLLNLEILEAERQRRRSLLAFYRRRLEGLEGLKIVSPLDPDNNSFQYFVLRVSEEEFGMSRDALYAEFRHRNIMVRKYFTPLCTEFTGGDSADFPRAAKACREVMQLPFYGMLTESERERIVDTVLESKR